MGSLLPSNTFAGRDIDLWQPAGDNQIITGNLTVIGNTELDAAVSCKNTLDVTNEITAGSITVAEGVISGAILAATQALGVIGNATISESLTVAGINCNGDFDMPLGNMSVLSSNPPTDTPDLNNGNITGTRVFGLNGTNSSALKTRAQVYNVFYWFGTDNLIVYIPLAGDPNIAPSLDIVMPADIYTNPGPYVGKRICRYLVQPFNPGSGLFVKLTFPDYASYTYTFPDTPTGLCIDVYFLGFGFFSNNSSPYVISWFPSNVVLPIGALPPS